MASQGDRLEGGKMGLFDDVLGSATGNRSTTSGMSPVTMALLGLLAYRTMQGKGRLADMLGMNKGGAPASQPSSAGTSGPSTGPSAGGGLGGLLGSLGGLFGGASAGSVLSNGLGDLVRQLQQNGHSDIANSWVNNGPNKPISPDQLREGLGNETVNSLADQSGLPADQLLSELSKLLPGVVDKLTPNGRLPTEQEAAHWM